MFLVLYICEFFLSTFTNLVDHFLKYSKSTPENNDFKTLTVAFKAEVPVSFNMILTLHTSIQGSTRTLVIPFTIFFELLFLKNM